MFGFDDDFVVCKQPELDLQPLSSPPPVSDEPIVHHCQESEGQKLVGGTGAPKFVSATS